ncbi:MAG: TonB-dependent receptor [Candidatus Omnitrophica bacterium]|nr:TonB-dependent receptor [Candidatus Omnitrophota bacterium]
MRAGLVIETLLRAGNRVAFWVAFTGTLFLVSAASAQMMGSIRGTVLDRDFDVPLAAVEISIAETGEKIVGTDEGNFVFKEVPPGKYTLVFSKDGYTRQVQANVVVSPAQMTDVDAALSGEFTDMEEFVVQDLQIGGGTEAGLLQLRIESPALMDSISADLMSQAGAGDAASALKLVSGATVQDGKFAVIRGLPDRYVNSQMNSVRLPTADPDKRAVQLDQFPSAVIESIQVSKTFTPDQQGDASGGAVNLVLKSIPEEDQVKARVKAGYNTQTTGNNDYLTYKGGGVGFLGTDDGRRELDGSFLGAVGVSRADAPPNFDMSVTVGGKREIPFDAKVGGFANAYYKRMNSYYSNGIDNSLWVEDPSIGEMTPQKNQNGGIDDFKTALFDQQKGTEEVQWGTLIKVGAEYEQQSVDFLYMVTRVAEDTALLSEDTRGKEVFFPGHDPSDPDSPGHDFPDAAPYLRTETLEYTERTTTTMQLSGDHVTPFFPDIEFHSYFTILPPEFDWTLALSSSELYQPNKVQFGSLWWPEVPDEIIDIGFGPMIIPGKPEQHRILKPAANFTMGNLQRIWKEIAEDSNQFIFNLKVPFEQWTEDPGYIKLGMFQDRVDRSYDQDSFSNLEDNAANYEAGYEDLWSAVFPSEEHEVKAADIDVDYKGEQEITAWYWMADVPLTSFFKLTGGIRYESTQLSIENEAESEVRWVPPGETADTVLNEGDADVSFKQVDELPSIGFEFAPGADFLPWIRFKPLENFKFRGSYTETVARQTFKELTPIQQQEFLGADVFIGNPELGMSSLENYDLRLDYTPYPGGLVSLSWFKKDVVDAIEYVQKRNASFGFTTPVNYPKGKLSGWEFEVRTQLGRFWEFLDGISIGGNATFIQSQVILPTVESGDLERDFGVSMISREMSNAPQHLYNLFLTYDLERFGTEIGLFYTVRGDTLIAGAGQSSGKFIPNVYEKEYGTLNFNLSQKIGEDFELVFQAKNLLDPLIQTIYRAEVLSEDKVKTSYQKGIDYTLSLSGKW